MIRGMTLAIIQFLPTAILAYLGFHVVFNPVDETKKKMKIFYTILIIACIIGSGIASVYQASQQDKEAVKSQGTITGLTNQVSDLKQQMAEQYARMTREFSANENISPNVKLAILADEQSGVLDEKTNLMQQQKMIEVNIPDLMKLRAMRENKEALE